jgi:O-antigen/teichoic acid export membrane protein
LSTRPSVVVSAIANWAAYGIAALVGFFLSPYVLHHLGNSGYGLWVLLASLVSYLGLLDLGVRAAITRFIAHHHATHDHAGASQVVVAALRLFTVLGAVALGLAVLLALSVDRLFTVPPEMLAVAQVVIVMGGASVAASFMGGVFGGIIAGLHRFDVDSGLEIALTLLRATLVVAALGAGYGLLALAVIQFGVTLLRGVAAFVAARHLYPELSLRGPAPVGGTIRTLLSFSAYSSLIHLSTVVLYHSDSVLIAAILPIGMITFFAIAMNLAEYARAIGEAVSRVVTPRVSATEAARDPAATRDVLLRVGQGTSLVMIPVALTFILRGETFINLWMGPDYGAVSGPILMLLGVTVWLAGGRTVAVSGLIGANRHRGLAGAFAVEAVVNLSLALLLIGPLGLMGVALGATLPSLLTSLGFLPWYINRSLGVPPGEFARQVWLRPSVAVLPFGLATYLVEEVWPVASIPGFFGQVLVLLPLVGLTGWRLMGSPGARARQPASVPNAASA